MQVSITITAETVNGAVQVSGMIDDMHIAYWLLGEARRLIEKRAAEREAPNKSGLVIVKGNLPT